MIPPRAPLPCASEARSSAPPAPEDWRVGPDDEQRQAPDALSHQRERGAERAVVVVHRDPGAARVRAAGGGGSARAGRWCRPARRRLVAAPPREVAEGGEHDLVGGARRRRRASGAARACRATIAAAGLSARRGSAALPGGCRPWRPAARARGAAPRRRSRRRRCSARARRRARARARPPGGAPPGAARVLAGGRLGAASRAFAGLSARPAGVVLDSGWGPDDPLLDLVLLDLRVCRSGRRRRRGLLLRLAGRGLGHGARALLLGQAGRLVGLGAGRGPLPPLAASAGVERGRLRRRLRRGGRRRLPAPVGRVGPGRGASWRCRCGRPRRRPGWQRGRCRARLRGRVGRRRRA